jgi:hypothetical protein
MNVVLGPATRGHLQRYLTGLDVITRLTVASSIGGTRNTMILGRKFIVSNDNDSNPEPHVCHGKVPKNMRLVPVRG